MALVVDVEGLTFSVLGPESVQLAFAAWKCQLRARISFTGFRGIRWTVHLLEFVHPE